MPLWDFPFKGVAFSLSGAFSTSPERKGQTRARSGRLHGSLAVVDAEMEGFQAKKGPPSLSFTTSPGEGGSPFFRVAINIRLSYKKSRGCPLFPFPARGLKLIARSGTVCSITREATNGQPPFCSPSIAPAPSPGPQASCSPTCSSRTTRSRPRFPPGCSAGWRRRFPPPNRAPRANTSLLSLFVYWSDPHYPLPLFGTL